MCKVELKMLIPPSPTMPVQHTGKQNIISISLCKHSYFSERNKTLGRKEIKSLNFSKTKWNTSMNCNLKVKNIGGFRNQSIPTHAVNSSHLAAADAMQRMQLSSSNSSLPLAWQYACIVLPHSSIRQKKIPPKHVSLVDGVPNPE